MTCCPHCGKRIASAEPAADIGLTPKQAQLLALLRQRLSRRGGVCPSFDEMAAALGLKSKSGIHRLITGLEERGYVVRRPRQTRALALVERGV